MTPDQPFSRRVRKDLRSTRQAFAEFLLVPTLIISAFLGTAALTWWLDSHGGGPLATLRSAIEQRLFADTSATGELLGTIASALITITSITVSLLLVALQQSASALTHQVYDQFLRNWHNQVYFGILVGLSLYALVTYATAGPLNPVIGALTALGSTIVALYLLLVLFYTTVNQMRPMVIIEAIHRHALQAREAQLELLRATRRAPGLAGAAHVVRVAAVSHGFVTSVDVGAIRSAVDRAGAAAEVVLLVSVGSYVVFGQALAEVRSPLRAAAVAVAGMLEQAIERGTKRDLANDPLDAIEELETIAWTSISTAQSDPDAGVLAIYGLRDMLARWHDLPEAGSADSPVVYADDVLPRLLSAFESLAVVASESMQHQSYAEILRTFDIVFERLLPAQRERVEDILKRTLSAMGEHVLTAELEGAITSLVATLERSGCARTAAALAAAMHKLAGSIGKLGSRATRPV